VPAGRVVDRTAAGVEERVVFQRDYGRSDRVEAAPAFLEDVMTRIQRALQTGEVKRLSRRRDAAHDAGAAVDGDDWPVQRCSMSSLSKRGSGQSQITATAM
jgi:hypothetical protein